MKKNKQNLLTLAFILPVVLLFFLFLNYVNSKEDTTMTDNEHNLLVLLETSKGNITIKLYEEEMPITVANFKKLVEEEYYDETKFHRIIPNFMIQGGDPLTKDESKSDNWGTGGPGYTIEDEFVKGLSNVRGTIAMANTGRPNSGGSQFFINVANNTFLDFDKEPFSSRHPVFGEVVEGMDVVDSIVSSARDEDDRPLQAISIVKASILQ